MAERHLLAEQLDYYRARASEYDEWWKRRGRYDRGTEANARWHAEIAEVRQVFDRLRLGDQVVELAAGTGYWTALLASKVRQVTVLEGSPEMIAFNQERLGRLSTRVDYKLVNLFEWQPSRRWDALVFCFWVSHVPRDRLAAFMTTCREAIVESGTMFFLDGMRTDESTAVDQALPDETSEVMVRKLNDGRAYRIVKNFYEPEELVATAGPAGFELEVHRTDTYFQFGVGTAR